MPTSLNSGSMPKVRASSGMIGTIRGPSSGSRMRLRRIRAKTIVVETGVALPAANSASTAAAGAGSGSDADDPARQRPTERPAALEEVLRSPRSPGPGGSTARP